MIATRRSTSSATARAERRGAEPRDRATSRPRTCACTSAGATTRARTTTTSRCATSSTSCFEARPAAISFEAANPRHEHEWTVFEDVKLPEGKVLIPGVLDSTTNYIEHPELVAQRIVRYAGSSGRENVMAGSDCGFATFASCLTGRPRDHLGQARAMAEGAELASKELYLTGRYIF